MNSGATDKRSYISEMKYWYKYGYTDLVHLLAREYRETYFFDMKITPAYFSKSKISINRLFYMLNYYYPAFTCLYIKARSYNPWPYTNSFIPNTSLITVLVKNKIELLPLEKIEQLLFPLSIEHNKIVSEFITEYKKLIVEVKANNKDIQLFFKNHSWLCD